ncbi:MAG: oligosaccharide flippase family protein [Treponema sp.]|nr:oligosaccharide flippase family protein [Treponema sp.]
MGANERTLAKNTVMLYVMQISGYVFPLLTFPYLTRVLGAEKYGMVVFANSIMSYFTIFIEFGFLISGTNSCSLVSNDKTKLGTITVGIIMAKGLLVVVGFFALQICCRFVPKIRKEYLFYNLSFIGIFLTIFLPDYLFRGIEKMSIITYRVVASKAAYTVLIFACIHNESNYLFVPVATIGSNLFAVILTWIEIIKKKIIKLCKVPFTDMLKYLKESSLFFLSRIASSFYTSLNTVLLGSKFSSASVGEYGVANTLTNTMRSLLSPISDSIYPYMIKEKNFKLVRKILLILEPVIIICCVVLWIVAKPFVRIVCGEGYENAVPMLRLMIPIVAITLPAYLCGYPVLGALGKIKWANYSIVFSASFHIVGLLLLFAMKKISFYSIIILTCITQYIEFFIRLFIVSRSFRKNEIKDNNK